ncbi:MAG: Mrp/NBP35 family ATP-binding protein [Thermoanaerobaculia bacterium]|nr:Mrp/NBP35 family ATP-binding protein [Thermoanaerobaculia bacterium]
MSQEMEAQVWEALKGVRFPGMSRDIVSFGFVRGVALAAGRVKVALEIATREPAAAEKVRGDVERLVAALPGVTAVDVELRVPAPPTREEAAAQAIARNPGLLPEVKAVVAVASGKGGVGKSTVAANLALALAGLGQRVGLLDVDIYGPSLPTMFGVHDRPVVIDNRIQPYERWGVKLMSIGFILDTDTPVIWRGPMVMKAIEQLMGDVDWGELDVMILDMPPGTGDAQLTVVQKLGLAGAVIVSTPQDVALIDARKGLAMFRKMEVPVLGLVENMATFVCPACGHETAIFRSGGGERTARELAVPFLGSIPLDAEIAEGGDAGLPIVVKQPDGAHAAAFRRVAEAVAAAIAGREAAAVRA